VPAVSTTLLHLRFRNLSAFDPSSSKATVTMRPTNYLRRPMGLVSSLVVSAPFLAGVTLAQDDNNNGNGNGNGNNGGGNGGTGNNNGGTGNNNGGDEGNENEDPAEESSASEAQQSSTTATSTTTTTTTSSSTTQTSAPTSASTTTTTSASSSRATGATNGGSRPTATLSRYQPIPTYPAAAVPPTVNAPFMQQSTMPQGTVFIAVGAILGAFGAAILLWRFIVGVNLHRSVQRAAMAQHDVNGKTGFPAPPAPFYKYTDQGSTMSLSGGAATTKAARRTTRGPIPSTNLSQSNLFFSPTAAASGTGGGNRSSAFLPSGFYAAGQSTPGAQNDQSISLSNLRPDSRGHYGNASRNTLNPSPPGSPSFPTARRDMSTSSLNLNVAPTGRAPSAYLDDLLADDPGSLPPPNMNVGGQQRGSVNLTSRTGSPSQRS
jgi:hypothetical protein